MKVNQIKIVKITDTTIDIQHRFPVTRHRVVVFTIIITITITTIIVVTTGSRRPGTEWLFPNRSFDDGRLDSQLLSLFIRMIR